VCCNGKEKCGFVSAKTTAGGDGAASGTGAANWSRRVMVRGEGRPAVAMLMPLQGCLGRIC
jgi:hypothetical protein